VEAASAKTQDRGKYGTKRLPSRKAYTRLTPHEIVRVLRLNAEAVSSSEIARITGISHQRITDIVTKHATTTDRALDVLKANSFNAATKWIESFTHAAKRGEHRPMRDALIAVGVVAPDPLNVGIQVVIGAGDVSILPSSLPNTPNTPETEHDNPTLALPLPQEPI
jgi:hypothetical protein